MAHREHHRTERVGWLRAAVLGANDGLLSTSSLVMGVAAAEAGRAGVLVAGVAGLVAGALSMAAGEYVSVSSQRDTEEADLHREAHELATEPRAEHEELTRIYQRRGLDRSLAERVATALMEKDALAAHARDELGIDHATRARPWQAAFASASSFALGAVAPLVVVVAAPLPALLASIAGSTLALLALLGALGARLGGARPLRPAFRVTAWGTFALAATAVIGKLAGVGL